MLTGKKGSLVLLMSLSIFSFAFYHPAHSSAVAGTNQQISFEGKLVNTDDTNIANGTYNVEYKVYQDGTNAGVGSTLLWTEDYLVAGSTGMPSTGGITLTNGTFSVHLGSICALTGGSCGAKTNSGIDFNQQTLWLSIQVGGTTACTVTSVVTSFNTACAGDGEMTPFIRLTAVPQALNSNLLNGLASSAFGQIAATQTWSGINTVSPTGSGAVALTVNGTSSGTPGTAINIVQGGAASNLTLSNTAATSQNLLSITQSTSAYTGTAFLLNVGVTTGSFASGNFIDLQKNAVSQFSIDNGGNINNGGNHTFLSGANRILSVQTQTAANTAGNNLTVIPATGLGTGAGGNLTIQAGTSGTGVTGNGGGLLLNGGNAASTAGNGGNITISPGTLSGSGVAGTIIIKPGALGNDNISFFDIQNAAGAPVLRVDTTSRAADGTTVNYLTYPGFESGSFANASTGWIQAGGATLSQNSTRLHAYNGLYSAQVVTTATANQGLTTSSFTTAPPIGTYIVSFYAKVSTGTMASTLFTVQSTDGATHTCSPSAGITINSSGFQRLFCQFPTTTAVMTALQITQNDATARTIYIDSAQLQSTTFNGGAITSPTAYQVGAIQIRGIIQNPMTIMPTSDSTTALQVYNAAGTITTLGVDTLNGKVSLGSGIITTINGQSGVIVGGGFSTSDTNLVALTLDSSSSLTETANTCSVTVNGGAMYYNSNVGVKAIRACINGNWEDLISTAGAFFTFFGIVPDSGAVPGDIQALSTASVSGPCKVSWLSTTSVNVTACTSYSGGQKVSVTATTLSITPANNNFFHICLTGTNNQPVVSAGSTTESANLSASSFPATSDPILCLADVKTATSAITAIYDTRVFTTTTKEYAYAAAALPLGVMVKPDATNINRVNLPGTTATGNMRGIVVASNGSAWASGGPNVVLATAGIASVKATAGTLSTTTTVQNSTTTSGYALTTATSANVYGNLGIAQNTFSNTCSSAITCNSSLLLDLRLR
jgi:hypothetical protein